MSDEETVRLWLVERDYNDKGLVTLAYATTDGERVVRQHRSEAMLSRKPVTAAIDVEADRPEPTEENLVDRYASEASRVADRNDPDDSV